MTILANPLSRSIPTLMFGRSCSMFEPAMTSCSPLHGTREAEWGSPLVRLSETSYRRGHRIARHAHGVVTVACVLGGGFVERQGSRVHECGPASLVLRPPSMEHEDTFLEVGGRCFNIEVAGELVVGGVPPRAVDVRAGPAVWAASRILAAARGGGPLDPLALESEVAALVEALCPGVPMRPSAKMARVAGELAQRFGEPWSLVALAREAELHPMHFARVFRAAYGESVGAHVLRLRLEYAGRELARTASPIAAIALAAGFADQAHLTRSFRRRTGLTPGRFRATFRGTSTLRSFKTR